MNDTTILIIEDEKDILEILEYNLEREGFDAVGFLSTKKVEQFIKEEDVDLMIVDRNLNSGIEGSDFVRYLKDKGYNIPTIFLSAKTDDKQLEEGFLVGCDDYIKKPFNMKELIFRIKAIIKRTKKETSNLHYKDMIIKKDRQEVFLNDKKLDLTKLEYNLLLMFLNNKNIVLDRDYIIDNIWGGEENCKNKTVNVAIKRLKDKISLSQDETYIHSIRGSGYIFS